MTEQKTKLKKNGELRMEPFGRPTKYNQELADKICSLVVEGKSLMKISKELCFDLSSFFEWIGRHKDFSQKYARAKIEQADTFAEEILEISDETIEKDALGRRDAGHINHNRLRVDSRKWLASKFKPKMYGDKLNLTDDTAEKAKIDVPRRETREEWLKKQKN
jgi:hypothetical protein